MIVGNVKKL